MKEEEYNDIYNEEYDEEHDEESSEYYDDYDEESSEYYDYDDEDYDEDEDDESHDDIINNYETIDNMMQIEHLIIIDPLKMPNVDIYYGHWQMYLFSKSEDEYIPSGNYFIYYKGRFFSDLKSKPMTSDEVQKIQLIANIYNKAGHPICVFRKERNI